MLDGNEDWPNGVPVAGTVLVIALLSVGAVVAGGYAGQIDDQFLGERSPQSVFAFSYDEPTERLTVEYVTGTEVERGQLLVVEGGDILARFPRDDAVTAGDAVTVEGVAATADVRVVWRLGTRRVELARWRGP